MEMSTQLHNRCLTASLALRVTLQPQMLRRNSLHMRQVLRSSWDLFLYPGIQESLRLREVLMKRLSIGNFKDVPMMRGDESGSMKVNLAGRWNGMVIANMRLKKMWYMS